MRDATACSCVSCPEECSPLRERSEPVRDEPASAKGHSTGRHSSAAESTSRSPGVLGSPAVDTPELAAAAAAAAAAACCSGGRTRGHRASRWDSTRPGLSSAKVDSTRSSSARVATGAPASRSPSRTTNRSTSPPAGCLPSASSAARTCATSFGLSETRFGSRTATRARS
eukprot:scaffold26182_cov90-Isochrysis_galbana.AAC.2